MYTNGVRNRASKRASKVRARGESRAEVEIFFLVGMIVATLLLVSPAMAQDGEARIRVAHLSPDAPPVMVEVDGEPVEELANVSYRDSTPYLPIPAGSREVSVYAVSDPSEPVLEVSVAPEAGNAYTVAGVGLLSDDTFGARLFEDDLSEPDEGEARVRVIHAVPDVGPATVGVADGPDLFSLPGFANASDYVGVEAGTYTLEATPAGATSPAFEVPDVEVEEGEVYTAFAVGQASEGTLGAMLTVDSDDGRLVGPQTLEDTSGDLSLLDQNPEPQPERASSTIAPINEEAPPEEKPEQKGGEQEKPKKEKPEKEEPARNTPAKSSQPENAQPEDPQPEARVESEPSGANETVGEVAGNVAPVEAYQAPVEATYHEAVPVETYQAPVEPAVVVPTAQEVVTETLASTGYVPQEPTVPAIPTPEIPAPEIPAPAVPVPEIPVPTIQTPQAPAIPDSGSAQVSAQTVVNEVTQSGFVPPATNAAVTQSVSQQAGGLVGGVEPVPTGEAVGTVISAPALVTSGPRRKFVTIRKRKPEDSA